MLELQPGTNQLVLKVCGDDAAPVVSLRLGDAAGGPNAEVDVTNDVTLSAEASALVQKLKDKKPSKLPTLEGPAQAFERLTAKKDVKPAELEAHARYLAETDGDDPAVHLARDLAQRAAETEPTIDRYLLVARLAEDQNRRNDWLSKAEALAEKRKETDEDLAPRARLQRRVGPNWREASPYFDRVIAMDPDNLLAVQGRVEVYHMAGPAARPRSPRSSARSIATRTRSPC